MLDPNQFQKALKNAEKFEKILKRMESIAAFTGIERGLSALDKSNDQVNRLLSKIQELRKESVDLAYQQAGISREIYKRVRFYDQELSQIKKMQTELTRAANLEKTQFNAKQKQRAAANAAAIASVAAEISRRTKVMDDLSQEYNLRIAIQGIDKDSIKIAQQLEENNGRTLELQKKLKELDSERVKIDTDKSKRLDDINKKLEEQNKIEAATHALQKAEEVQRKEFQKSKFSDLLKEKLGGGALGSIVQLVSAIKGLGVVLGVFAALALLIKALVDKYRDALKATIEAGLDASQRLGIIAQGQRVVAEAFRKGALLDLSEVVKAQVALADRLGTLDISDTVVLKSAELSRQLNLSTEEAADLLTLFIRIRGQSAETAAFSTVLIKATALQNRVNPATIMRDVANNAANFAKSGRASADEMARAAILVRQLGTNLNTVANIADRVVTDFEGTLEAQATISTFAPGFDLTGLMVASQFGSDVDIARELKKAVDSLGTNFDSLPRSFKLAISSSLGIPMDELVKIAHGQASAASPGEQAIIDAQKNSTNELQHAVVDPLASLSKGVFGIFSFLVNRWGTKKDKEGAESVISSATGAKTVAAQSRATGGTVGVDSARSQSLFGMLRGLSSNEIPTILHRGEAVLNQAQMSMLSQLTDIRSNFGKSISSFVGKFTSMFGGGKTGGARGRMAFGGGRAAPLNIGGFNVSSLLGTATSGLQGLLGGGVGGILGNITSLFGGKGGIGGGLTNLLSGGVGGIVKNLGSSLFGGGNLAKLGASVGSIIPGVGTLLGGGLGAAIGSLSKTGIGKAVGGVVKSIGGLFHKKKKAPEPPKTSAVDISQLASLSGLLNFGAMLGVNSLQGGGIKTPTIGGASPSSLPIGGMTGSTSGIEQRLDLLITLLRNGSIGLNVDGKKLSDALTDANRYG